MVGTLDALGPFAEGEPQLEHVLFCPRPHPPQAHEHETRLVQSLGKQNAELRSCSSSFSPTRPLLPVSSPTRLVFCFVVGFFCVANSTEQNKFHNARDMIRHFIRNLKAKLTKVASIKLDWKQRQELQRLYLWCVPAYCVSTVAVRPVLCCCIQTHTYALCHLP